MTGTADEVQQAAAALSSDVDAAITRASRAAGEAREQAERFRDDTGTGAGQEAAGGPSGTGPSTEASGRSGGGDDRRGSRSGDEGTGDDEDFSQQRILS